MSTTPKFFPIPVEVSTTTPTSGKILIVPYPPKMLRDPSDTKYRWGGEKRSGYMTIKGKPIEGWDYMGSTLSLDGGGLLLNMENEEHRRLYMIFKHSDQFRGVISENKGKRYPNSRFYFQNNELEIIEYLKSVERSDAMVDRIRSLRPEEVSRIALWFGITGSDELKRGSLRKMTETESGMNRLQEVLMNPDRQLMELVAVAESKGDASKKQGLWKNKATGVYYWNAETIGLEREGAITYLKKNTELQHEMRKIYLSEPLNPVFPPQAPQKPEEKIENPIASVKVIDPTVDKTKKGWYINIEELKEAYAKDKSPYNLGEKFKDPDTGNATHWKTIQKLLKENGIV